VSAGTAELAGDRLALARDLHRTMLRIRRFEERAGELFRAGEMPGFVHLSLGQEAVAAGVVSALREDDAIAATHRGHGHIIAKGGRFGPMMAELYGKDTGYCRGKGGSMHIFDLELGILGANGIIGAGAPIAVGAALSARLRGDDSVAVSFFGEGASAQGSVHEAMNLASVWGLPVVFVAEVNGFAELTPYAVHAGVESLALRGGAYGIPAQSVDGLDALAVHDAATAAVEHAREGRGPQLLEARMVRWRGHYEGDPQKYRDPDELERGLAGDPLAALEARMPGEDLGPVRAEVERELDEAIAFARSSPLPAPADALEHVYVEPLPAARGPR
jgi:acetoin:2,6-dichlorophenolindophenol oxidoreductase subunit alpha